ncbi:MAG: FkbM family methyltransferase [Phycisphaerales bacterium]|nr:FkbM family methyltransferase [Phycisphaerales bacterium]MCB9841447.1 FkbM family methyltransferase [Phycisphaeraceae bacterium]
MPGLFGKLIRTPLRLMPSTAVVPILSGPNRGLRWVVGASTHGNWLGTFEGDKPRRMAERLKPGMTVFDVGANVGYFTLLSARSVGPEGKVFAFEPLTRNLEFLRRHVKLNALDNVAVLDSAVSEHAGTAHFSSGENHSMAHLADAGEFEVRLIGLDEEIDAGRLPDPNVLKMDIEGAESTALRGAKRMLERARPLVFLATHGPDIHAECLDLLRGVGYRVSSLDDKPVESTREVFAEPA